MAPVISTKSAAAVNMTSSSSRGQSDVVKSTISSNKMSRNCCSEQADGNSVWTLSGSKSRFSFAASKAVSRILLIVEFSVPHLLIEGNSNVREGSAPERILLRT